MEIVFELLLNTLAEGLLQGLFELGGRGIVAMFRKDDTPSSRWLSIVGYLLMGAIAGGLSVWLIPMHLVNIPLLQLANLAVTPILLGFIFEAFGRWKTNHEKPRYSVDRFSYGFTFALTMGLVRYAFAARLLTRMR